MKRNLIAIVAGWALLGLSEAKAQPISLQTISYMVTYDGDRQQYTAWLVPNYNTPNTNNTKSDERGATAQFTLKVPASFTLNEITDITGTWDKRPLRFGQEKSLLAAGADPTAAYYVIGKMVEETNYGAFKLGEPVALFRFKGQGGRSDQIQVLDRLDPIIGLADRILSLNIGNSFYSRSGQTASARPMEQFAGAATVFSVLKQVEKQIVMGSQGSAMLVEEAVKLVLYPNPTQSEVQLKVFSQRPEAPVRIALIDSQGGLIQSMNRTAQPGINTFKFNVSHLTAGIYFVKTEIDGKNVVKAVNKL